MKSKELMDLTARRPTRCASARQGNAQINGAHGSGIHIYEPRLLRLVWRVL